MSSQGNPVVIVGAGPAGLGLAIELGMRAVPCVVLEKCKTTRGEHRAKMVHSRAREHLRRWGIADKLAAVSPLGLDYPTNVTFVTRLGGHFLRRFEWAWDCLPLRNDQMAEPGQWVPQYKLVDLMLERAITLPGVEVRFGSELVACTQDERGVTAHVRDAATGADSELRAGYLVGADGVASAVRKQIGADMLGNYGISRNYTVIFRAPGLSEAHPHGTAVMFWQINTDVPSIIGPTDEGDIWYLMLNGLDDPPELSKDAALDMIRRSTGIDLPYEIISIDRWIASALVASSLRQGDIFLIGDAAHVHPTNGGFGMNLGIADAADLGWKLAAVLQGWAPQRLLDSYEAERREVHEIVVGASERFHQHSAPELAVDGADDETEEAQHLRDRLSHEIWRLKRGEFFSRPMTRGYAYSRSPIVVPDGTGTDWATSDTFRPSAMPGAVAPHCWMKDGSSLYDHFGAGFTLLVTEASAWSEADRAAVEARAAGVPLKLLGRTNGYPEKDLRRLYGARLVLIRPDQHVAWRGDRWPADGVIARVTGQFVECLPSQSPAPEPERQHA